MKILIVILLSISFASFCKADDIYTVQNVVYRNVKIIGEKIYEGNPAYVITFRNRVNSALLESFILKSIVLKIDILPVDERTIYSKEKFISTDDTAQQNPLPIFNNLSNSERGKIKIQPDQLMYKQSEREYEYPNSMWFSFSALAFGLSWDFFSKAGDYQDAIDANNKLSTAWKTAFKTDLNFDNSKLESAKTRMTVLGILSIGAGIISFSYAIKSVEIKSNGNSLSLAYHF